MLIVSELTQCADRQFQLSTTRFLKLIVFHPVFWIVHSHVFCIQPTQTGKIYSLEYCKLRLKSCRFQSPLILLFRFWFQWVYHYGKFTLILNLASWWLMTPYTDIWISAWIWLFDTRKHWKPSWQQYVVQMNCRALGMTLTTIRATRHFSSTFLHRKLACCSCNFYVFKNF